MTDGRVPPQNIDAEKAVLACCLLSSDVLSECVNKLQADDFYVSSHKQIFSAISSIISNNNPVDIITVSDYMQKKGVLKACGGTSYIASISDTVVIIKNISKYIDMVLDSSIRRKVISTLDKAMLSAYDNGSDCIESINNVVCELKANRNNQEEEGLIDISDYVSYEEETVGIPTGFEIIDEMTDGFAGGMYTVITGKRGNGKSTLASQIVLTAINEGYNVGFYSGELTVKMFQEWLFSQAAGSSGIEEYRGFNGAPKYRATEGKERKIRKWLRGKLFLYDNQIVKSNEMNTIVDRFRICAEKYNCKLFFVDNLKSAKFKVNCDKDYYRKQSEFVKDLKHFAMEYNVHVVIMAHLNKSNVEDISDNVEGSSDITDLASNVWKIDRLEGSNRQTTGADAVITIAKNRDCGTLGKVFLKYNISSRRYTCLRGSTKYKYNLED